MEWEGKTIYDLLNFAKEEAVKIIFEYMDLYK